MAAEALTAQDLRIHPVSAADWTAIEQLFGPRGACAGCWCMFWRPDNRADRNHTAEENREELHDLVDSGREPGLIAYQDGVPVGWCSVGPREVYSRLERSRKLKRVDDKPVWSIVCFFVARSHRRRGLMTPLLHAALDYAHEHGASVVEGYPVEAHERLSGDHGYTGIASAYRDAGFSEVARPTANQLIMRYTFS